MSIGDHNYNTNQYMNDSTIAEKQLKALEKQIIMNQKISFPSYRIDKVDAAMDSIGANYAEFESEDSEWNIISKDQIERIYQYDNSIWVRTNSGDLIRTKFKTKEEAIQILF